MAKILIVDDDKAVSGLLEMAVKALGHETLVASDGYSAMPAFQKLRPDLVILDFAMPAGDGGQVYQKIRALEIGSKIPILFVTATPMNQVKAAVPEQPNVRFVQKPIDMDGLGRLIGELLNLQNPAGPSGGPDAFGAGSVPGYQPPE